MTSFTVHISGKSAQLDKKLGKGGEGDVYALVGSADKAVKIYKEALRSSREAKVRAMVESRLADSTSLVAFPFSIATDSSGKFAGFVMRLVEGYRPLHEIYSPKSRKIHFPKADYRFLIRVAQNVARAVATVHQAGCVIGDLNHSGVLVAADATVALIDADSFQFTRNGRSYPCVVGTEDFTPPELHGLNLGRVERTQAHDNFGLAVAIFQLLFMGKHPYAGRFGGADLSLGEAIAQNRFAFSKVRCNETRTTPPPGSILLEDFPPLIAEAFEKAFGLNAKLRPDSIAWVNLLQELESKLRRCGTASSHYFPGTGGSCVWCRLASQSGVEMFPQDFLAGILPTAGAFDFERIWTAIQAAPLPRPEDLIPVWVGDAGPPSTALEKIKSKRTSKFLLGCLAILSAIAGFVFAPAAMLLWGGMGAFGVFQIFSIKNDDGPLRKAYSDADSRVRATSLAYLQRIGFNELLILRAELNDNATHYRQLDEELAQKLARLKATREARQLSAFLDRFLIQRAKIPGIGPAKTATLASFGIESAADVTTSAVRAVPGFGDALTNKMLDWRRSHESKFRYNPTPDPSDIQAENAVRSATVAKRVELQKKLRSGLAALQSAPTRFASSRLVPDQPLMHALGERAKAARDCSSMGIALPSSAPLTIALPKRTSVQPSRTPSPPSSIRPAGAPTCPNCGASMRRRTARKGNRAGIQFWGCSRYPLCKGTRN